jgi:hypothetical protein
MSQTNESSVLFALKELQRLEADRLAEEDRKAEAARQELRRQEEEARAKSEHAARVAEAEARLRVEADLRAQEADAERRMAALRAEIEAVRADRERMHARIVTAAAELEPVAPKPALGKRIAMASFGLASLTALGLSIWIATRPPVEPAPRIIEVPVATQGTVVEDPVAPVQPMVEEPIEVQPAPVAERPRPTPTGMRITTMQTTQDMSDMRLDLIDRCGDDPLCGTDDL